MRRRTTYARIITIHNSINLAVGEPHALAVLAPRELGVVDRVELYHLIERPMVRHWRFGQTPRRASPREATLCLKRKRGPQRTDNQAEDHCKEHIKSKILVWDGFFFVAAVTSSPLSVINSVSTPSNEFVLAPAHGSHKLIN